MKVREYKILQGREDSTMASTWNCYLCLENADNGLRLCVKGYEALGFANDLAELDENDDYILPETVDGKKVGGVEDDVLVSDTLVDDEQYEALSISFDETFDREVVQTWLTEERWDPALVIEVEQVWKAGLKH